MKYPLYQKTLCPKIWQNETLAPEVQQGLLKIATDFVEGLKEDHDLTIEILDVVMVGSVANYNWSQYSDIDLHIVTSYEKLGIPMEEGQIMFDALKGNWNTKHDITVKGHDVELYVQDKSYHPSSAAEYSVLKNKWLKKPTREHPTFDKELIKKKYGDYKKQIETLVAKHDEEALRTLLEKIYKFRQAGLDAGGELSEENIIFKVLRAHGLLDKIRDSVNAVYDKKMSVKESLFDKPEDRYDEKDKAAVVAAVSNAKAKAERLGKPFNDEMEDEDSSDRTLDEIEQLDDGIYSHGDNRLEWHPDSFEGKYSMIPTDDDSHRKNFTVNGVPIFAAYRVMPHGVDNMRNSGVPVMADMVDNIKNVRHAVKHPNTSDGSNKMVSALIDLSIKRMLKNPKFETSKVTVIIPLGSSSKLNDEVAKKLQKVLPNATVLDDFLQKDVWKNVKLSKAWYEAVERAKQNPDPEKLKWFVTTLKNFKAKQQNHPNEIFSVHNVGATTRHYYSMFYKTNKNHVVDAVKLLNGAHVLFIDDTLEGGTTLREVTRAIKEYNVASVKAYIFLFGKGGYGKKKAE